MIDFRIAAAGAAALAAAACIGPGDFHCTEHNQCTIGTKPGFCEANGRCSVEDSTCTTSLRRYAHRTGDDADACVPACDVNAVDEISAGGGHACLLRARDKSLWCWGRNDHGQIGDGSRTPRSLPVRVPVGGPVAAVATGDLHTCAAMVAGPVLCWGANDAGQLGDVGIDDKGFPQQVPGVTNANALAAGKDFSCAVDMNGVRCWGDDSVGQLGDGVAGPRRMATVVAGLAGVTAVSAMWQHACALRADKSLVCWGANDQGQIGDGSPGGLRPPTDLTALIPPISAVATGRGHTCALGGDGLRCWGANDQGQIHARQPSAPVLVPTQPMDVNSGEAIRIAAGAQHTCLVRQGEGEVVCWGADESDQLGGGPDAHAIPNAAKVAAGATFTCALASDHAIYCWGDNHFGQLAIGGQRFNTTPVQVPGIAHAGALAAGGAHTCATADDANGGRALFCWGANGSSQLGNGGSLDAPVATRISSFAPDAIAAGGAHTCAFSADRELRCWGAGAAGQLGITPGPGGVVTIPTINDLSPPQGGDGVFSAAAGASHTCVGATISTSVLCFGLDGSGQLGHPPADNATAVTAGDRHSCALDDQGAVWCWGANDSGQLGDGIGTNHPDRFQVVLGNGVTRADAIAAGAEHTCALAGGRIICWGRNAEGQVGIPLQQPIPAPEEVMPPFSKARAIAAGGRHTCAIDADATVKCWGANESGQLGIGNTDSKNVPTPVVGLTNVDAIAAGGAHSCARRSDGTVWCWGANTFGQLGDGITLTSPSALLARIACE